MLQTCQLGIIFASTDHTGSVPRWMEVVTRIEYAGEAVDGWTVCILAMRRQCVVEARLARLHTRYIGEKVCYSRRALRIR